ncbi:MAG: TIGR04086 family membrane protein, partial [Christensenellales bacterium]
MHSNRMNALIAVTRGVVCAAICTLVGMLIMGVAAGYTGITDSTIQVLNQVLKLTSAIAGAFVAVRPGGDKGLIKGALVGAAYM